MKHPACGILWYQLSMTWMWYVPPTLKLLHSNTRSSASRTDLEGYWHLGTQYPAGIHTPTRANLEGDRCFWFWLELSASWIATVWRNLCCKKFPPPWPWLLSLTSPQWWCVTSEQNKSFLPSVASTGIARAMRKLYTSEVRSNLL